MQVLNGVTFIYVCAMCILTLMVGWLTGVLFSFIHVEVLKQKFDRFNLDLILEFSSNQNILMGSAFKKEEKNWIKLNNGVQESIRISQNH